LKPSSIAELALPKDFDRRFFGLAVPRDETQKSVSPILPQRGANVKFFVAVLLENQF
jgi:hypothetical protein